MSNFKTIQTKFSQKQSLHYYFETEKCIYVVKFNGSIKYLNCFSKGCLCKAKIENDLLSRTNHHEHNHSAHSHFAEFETAFDKLKHDVDESCLPIRQLHRVALRSLSREAAGMLCWRNVRSTLQRIRRSKLPICRNYSEFEILMESNKYVFEIFGQIRGNNFYQGSVNKQMVFALPELISSLEQGFEIYLDATFKCTPFHTRQLFIVMATILNKPRPLIFVIMTEQSEENYKYVLEFIRDAVLPGNGCFSSPSAALADFEPAMRNAIRYVWPNIEMRGCNFHLCQAFMRNARKIASLSKKIKQKKKFPHHRVLIQFMRLSLLPENRVENGIKALISFINNNIELAEDFKPFIKYFQHTWTQRYSIKDWNVSNCRYRTNNVVEGYNSKVKKWIPLNPSPWDFMEALLDLAIDADSSYENSRQKEIVSDTDLSKLTPALQRALSKLNNNEINELQFLDEMAIAGKVPEISI